MSIATSIVYCPRPGITRQDNIKWLEFGGFDITYFSEEYDRGIIGNSMHALFWMIANTKAEWLILFENDVTPCRNARKILQNLLDVVDHTTIGSISLYTPSIYSPAKLNPGWNQLHMGYANVAGQCVCFHRDRIQWLLSYINWRSIEAYSKINDGNKAGGDAAISELLMLRNLPILFHNPSLCEHVGIISSRKTKNTHHTPVITSTKNINELSHTTRTNGQGFQEHR